MEEDIEIFDQDKKENSNLQNNSFNFFKKSLIVGFVTGIVLAIVNTISMGVVGMIFGPLLTWLSFSSGCFAGGEGCWGTAIIFGDILFFLVTPFLFIFLKYVFDRKYFPYNKRKIIKVTIIFLLIFLINGASLLEMSFKNFGINNNGFGIRTFSSVQECGSFKGWGYEIIGDCQGYFASQKGGIDYCNNLEGPVDIKNECINSYAIHSNDVNNCSYIKNKVYNQKCIATYYIAKQEKGGCQKVEHEYWKKECNAKIGNYYSFMRWYSNLRGEDFKPKKSF